MIPKTTTITHNLNYRKLDGILLTEEEIRSAECLRHKLITHTLCAQDLYPDEIRLLYNYECYTIVNFSSHDDSIFLLLQETMHRFIPCWSKSQYQRSITRIRQAHNGYEKTHAFSIKKEQQLLNERRTARNVLLEKQRKKESMFQLPDVDL